MADTIFALAIAPGTAGVAVVRVSGPLAWTAGARFGFEVPKPRLASLRILRGETGDVIDEALVLAFDQGESFTGEKVIELQCHGSPSVVARIFGSLSGMEGFRLAEPGEFTRRAFENGTLDLVQVEGLADLIASETDVQRKQAVNMYTGELSGVLKNIDRDLRKALALCEATIDFVDEEGVPDDLMEQIVTLARSVRTRLQRQLTASVGAHAVRRGFEVAILGPPNVGKSTLLNALADQDAAIVSPIAGTTRDIVEVCVDVGGLLVSFLDTAGIRESDDRIEALGVERGLTRGKEADLRLFLVFEESWWYADLKKPGDLVVHTKGDLRQRPGSVSAKTGVGIASLLKQIGEVLGERIPKDTVAASVRQQNGLAAALASVESALTSGSLKGEFELVAEDLRAASRSLEFVLGRVDVEDMLSEIFSSFCIGK